MNLDDDYYVIMSILLVTVLIVYITWDIQIGANAYGTRVQLQVTCCDLHVIAIISHRVPSKTETGVFFLNTCKIRVWKGSSVPDRHQLGFTSTIQKTGCLHMTSFDQSNDCIPVGGEIQVQTL